VCAAVAWFSKSKHCQGEGGRGKAGGGAVGNQSAHLLTSGGSLCALFRKAAMPAIADEDMVTGVAAPGYVAHALQQRLK